MPDVRGYFDDIVNILLSVDLQATLLRKPEVRVRDNHAGRLHLEISYADRSQLRIRLEANCSGDFPVLRAYRFHYFHPSEGLRFRYDNAPHYRDLPNFPHHLHLGAQEILPLGPPSLRQVAAAIRWHLDHPGQPWNPKSY